MPRRRGYKLQDEDLTEALVELVRQHPVIYDFKSPYHRDPRTVKETWKQIAESLQNPNITGNDVKVRWRTLRDTYLKKKKEIAKFPAGRGESLRIRWKYMTSLRFLDPYLIETGKLPISAMSSDEEGITPDTNHNHGSLAPDDARSCSSESSVHLDLTDLPEDAAYLSDLARQAQAPASSSNSSSRKRKPTLDDPDLEFKKSFLELVKWQSVRLDDQRRKEESRSPLDGFFESCALRAKSLSKAKQGWLQLEISSLLYTAENSDSSSHQQLAPGPASTGVSCAPEITQRHHKPGIVLVPVSETPISQEASQGLQNSEQGVMPVAETSLTQEAVQRHQDMPTNSETQQHSDDKEQLNSVLSDRQQILTLHPSQQFSSYAGRRPCPREGQGRTVSSYENQQGFKADAQHPVSCDRQTAVTLTANGQQMVSS